MSGPCPPPRPWPGTGIQQLLSKCLLNKWMSHHPHGHRTASENSFSSPHSLSANRGVIGDAGDYTEKTLRSQGFHPRPLWLPACSSPHSFPTLGSVRVLWLMHGFVPDLSSIHSLALSPFECLLYAGPGLWRKWGSREEWEGSLPSWTIQTGMAECDVCCDRGRWWCSVCWDRVCPVWGRPVWGHILREASSGHLAEGAPTLLTRGRHIPVFVFRVHFSICSYFLSLSAGVFII